MRIWSEQNVVTKYYDVPIINKNYRLRKNWLFCRFTKWRLLNEFLLIEQVRSFGSISELHWRRKEFLVIFKASSDTISSLSSGFESGRRPMPKVYRTSAGIGTSWKSGSSAQSGWAIASTPSVEGGAVMHDKHPRNSKQITPITWDSYITWQTSCTNVSQPWLLPIDIPRMTRNTHYSRP